MRFISKIKKKVFLLPAIYFEAFFLFFKRKKFSYFRRFILKIPV
jgi:hypothetical protein